VTASDKEKITGALLFHPLGKKAPQQILTIINSRPENVCLLAAKSSAPVRRGGFSQG
jgi:hypothetical protein